MDKALLKEQIHNLEEKPGIYQYYDKDSALLYVGKAKNLKKRIKSYFDKDLQAKRTNSLRIQKMVAQVHSLHTIIVENEKEALILENFFIKSQNPRYNILLRDDKTYPYIMINTDDKYPRFVITRKIENKKGLLYFGPYPRGAREILASIYELFPIVQEASCMRSTKACLYYQIQKCLGVCEFDTIENEKTYKAFINEAILLMQNKYKMKKKLEEKMLYFADNELFEQAITCRNCLDIIAQVEHFSTIDMKRSYNADILSFVYEKGIGVLLKLFVRNGRVISAHHIFVKANDCQKATELDFEYEIYNQAILKTLQEDIHCSEIILANISKENLLSLQDFISNTTLKLIFPKRGDKLKLSQLALLNANHILQNCTQVHTNEDLILKDIASLFGLKQDIISIEIFDTSHHSGNFCVGGMVSYINNEFYKKNYRHYSLTGKDEYAQMREMLSRRAASFDILAAPSLWLIDGGLAQINIALEILESTGANVEVLAIAKEKIHIRANRAKGRARDVLRSKYLEFRLDSNDKRLLLLQKLRDEAHRFAIEFHRKRKLADIRN